MLRWRKFNLITMDGVDMGEATPYLQNSLILLEKIMKMPKENKIPITYDDACNLFLHEQVRRALSDDYHYLEVRAHWYKIVEWLTSEGYYLELKGDEFEYEQTN